MFPLDANTKASAFDMSLAKAARKATSELKGKTVAANKEDKKRAVFVIGTTFEKILYFQLP